AFIAELSFQLLGYASFLIPATIGVIGWRYFWCRALDSVYTKVTGTLLLFACSSAFMAVTLGSLELGSRSFRAGGSVGEWIGGLMSDGLSRTGSVIVLMAIMAGAVILATQFSFGRLFSLLFEGVRGLVRQGVETWRVRKEERRKAQLRREVMAKHGKADAPAPIVRAPATAKAAPERAQDPAPSRERIAARPEPAAGPRTTPAVVQARPPVRQPSAQPLPLPEPDRSPVERRLGGFTLPPLTLLDPPKAEAKIDERELMDAA